jgi:hypothetical protein
MGRRGCTERACDSRPGGYENRGEGGFRGVPPWRLWVLWMAIMCSPFGFGRKKFS